MSSYVNVFGGNTIQTGSIPYLLINLTNNITLSWPIQFQDTNLVVANNMDVNCTTLFNTITLPPVANTVPTIPQPYVPLGQAFQINNVGPDGFTLQTNQGASSWNIAAGTSWFFYVTGNSTIDGTFRQIPMAGGVTAVTSVAAAVNAGALGNLTITGSPIVSAGTLTFNFANDLAALIGFGSGQGYAVRTAANTWHLNQILGTTNQIVSTNPRGIAGDTVISLPTTITGISNLSAADFNFATNVISTVNANENIILSPNGTGLVEVQGSGMRVDSGLPVYFYGTNNTNWVAFQGGNQTTNNTFTWPTVAPAANQVLQFQGGTALGWATITTFGGPSTINALARYSSITGSLANSTVLLDGAGNLTGVNSIAIQNINIGVAGSGAISTVANANLLLEPNGIGEVQSTANISIFNGQMLKIFEPTISGNNYSSFAYPASANTINYTLPTSPPTSFGFQSLSQVPGGTIGALQWANAPANKNLLINGSFLVWQRNTSFTNATYILNNNNTYTADCWKLQSNGNNIVTVAQGAAALTTAYASTESPMVLTVVTANTKFGIVQYLDAGKTASLINQNVTFSFNAAATGNINSVKCAIIAWVGAADVPTSSIVTAWNAQGTNPTLAANWSYVGAPFSAIVGATGYFAPSVPYTINTAGVKNIALFMWVDNTNAAINNTLTVGPIKLEQGSSPTVYQEIGFSNELIASKAFFQKDLPYGTAVGTTAFLSSTKGTLFVSPINGIVLIPTASPYAAIDLEGEMYTVPTFTIYPCTTTTNLNRVSNDSGTDQAANTGTIVTSNANGFVLSNTSGGNLTTTGFLLFHYTADAGFNT